MKTRNGFVSNSSSSSFIIPLDMLNERKIQSIYNHIKEAKEHSDYYDFGCVYDEDSWYISENENYIMGDTIMDNFSMSTFLIHYLRIPRENIKWD